MNATDSVKALLRRLEDAFGGLPIPSAAELVRDSSGDHLECNQIMETYGGRHWQTLAVDDLVGEADSLSFLSSEGFRFLLPAFVRASLLDYDGADLIPMVIVWSLMSPKEHGQSRDSQRRITAFTAQQRRVLREFLSYLGECHPQDLPEVELERARFALTEPEL